MTKTVVVCDRCGRQGEAGKGYPTYALTFTRSDKMTAERRDLCVVCFVQFKLDFFGSSSPLNDLPENPPEQERK